MGECGKNSKQVGDESKQQDCKTVMFLDTEMRFSSKEFAEAFTTKISEAARKRIWAYYKTRKTTDAIRLLGLNGSQKQFSSRLNDIIHTIGAKSKEDLFGWKERSQTNKVDPEFLKRLIEKQEYRCALSGVVLTPDEAELDHVVPFEQGGKHVKSNVQWVHKDVNRMKAQMRQPEFLEWCRKVALWHG